jgi:hemerythrin-like domain-containing protein
MGLGFMTAQDQMRFWFAVTWVLGLVLPAGVIASVVDLLTLKAAPQHRVCVEKAVEFLRGFADRCHHGKEENIPFEAMVEGLDFPRDAGPVAVLMSEHVVDRDFIRKIAEAAAGLERDPTAARRVIENGRGCIQPLRVHAEREDSVVFPMVEQFLDDADNARLAAKLDPFERDEMGGGKHEALVRLLADLTRDA